ncbi:ABC-F family ATP-binding cassette domain-containing protein, partial [bacterium]|nr:ABC-F family ATP-binding cassette domain-containing protein [bacterium]
DEPTNHLDENSKAVLRDALRAYQGTLVLVSHDRYFIDQIVNKVIDIEDGTVAVHLGNYSEYLNRKQQQTAMTATATKSTKKDVAKTQVKKSKEQKRLEAEERKKQYAEQKAHETLVGPIERKIEKLETEKGEIEAEMAQSDFYNNAEKAKTVSLKHKQISDALQSLYQQWEELI